MKYLLLILTSILMALLTSCGDQAFPQLNGSMPPISGDVSYRDESGLEGGVSLSDGKLRPWFLIPLGKAEKNQADSEAPPSATPQKQ